MCHTTPHHTTPHHTTPHHTTPHHTTPHHTTPHHTTPHHTTPHHTMVAATVAAAAFRDKLSSILLFSSPDIGMLPSAGGTHGSPPCCAHTSLFCYRLWLITGVSIQSLTHCYHRRIVTLLCCRSLSATPLTAVRSKTTDGTCVEVRGFTLSAVKWCTQEVAGQQAPKCSSRTCASVSCFLKCNGNRRWWRAAAAAATASDATGSQPALAWQHFKYDGQLTWVSRVAFVLQVA
jgi:hypothetical protein